MYIIGLFTVFSDVTSGETVVNADIADNAFETQLNTELNINAANIQSGTCLLDKYAIIEPLNAVSGEADLYLCEYYGDRYVAKIYRREVAVKSEVIRAVKNIKSPYMARLFDTGMYNSNRPFEIFDAIIVAFVFSVFILFFEQSHITAFYIVKCILHF